MKRAFTLLCVGVLMLSMAGCRHRTEPPLPSDIHEVVETPVATPDNSLPDSGQITIGSGTIGSQGQSGDSNATGRVTADVESVRAWLSDSVTSEYDATQDGMVVKETATGNHGGTVSIMMVDNAYRGTEFRYPLDGDEAVEAFTAYLGAYLQSELIDIEIAELQDGIATAESSGDIYYMNSLATAASVYIMVEDGELVMQCY